MKRRDFLFVAALLAPAIRRASAQQPATKKRLAVIVYKVEDMRIGRSPLATIFFEELQRLGYVEGGNLIIDRGQYQSGRLEEIAREVVDTNPDVIASPGTPMTASPQSGDDHDPDRSHDRRPRSVRAYFESRPPRRQHHGCERGRRSRSVGQAP